MKIDFNVDKLMESLPLMGKGMLGIFVVISVIMLTIFILNKTTSTKKKSKDNE